MERGTAEALNFPGPGFSGVVCCVDPLHHRKTPTKKTQLPHVGKVIQPQPRGVIQTPSTSKSESANGSSKPAWRNVKQGGSTTGVGPPSGVQSEFPTAAEVAQGAFVDYLHSCMNHSRSQVI